MIENDPDRLFQVPGIGKTRVDQIKKSWTEQKEIKNIMLFLQGHDVSTSHATKIFKTYGSESISVVQENPYRLADDIWGIGFRTADTIAEKMGFGHERYARLRSGLLYTLNRLADEGHCYATRSLLIGKASELLKVEDNVLSLTLDEMIRARDVILDPVTAVRERGTEAGTAGKTKITGTTEKTAATATTEQTGPAEEAAIYLPPFFFAETGAARRLGRIFRNREGIAAPAEGLADRIAQRTGMNYDEVQIQAILTAVRSKVLINYDEVQIQAILTAVRSKVLILTGGPGTGKTTTTLGIITAFRSAGARVLLAAPTGRAAKRLSEVTGLEAKTIHRLLEVKPPEGYQKNEDNPLEGDVLIVDECSMIDLLLFYNLLKAVPDTMTLIFVGDIDQLPSVGAGNVLRDLIESDCFPVVRLTRIFRQASKSRIITNAHRINAGRMPDLSNGRDSDFFFMDMENPVNRRNLQDLPEKDQTAQAALQTIIDLVQTRLPRYYHIPSSDIQVLTPMQRGVVGAANLNQELQKALNPPVQGRPGAQGLRRGGFVFRARDKVMQIRNNYDKEVFNGDIGVVQSVDTEEKTLRILFDEREVEYDISELDELVLAYAATIHKAQGSEYPVVVMPVLMNHYIMLQRNLIYTGITRAGKVLVIAGTRKALSYAVRNVTVTERNTMLCTRLRKEQDACESDISSRSVFNNFS